MNFAMETEIRELTLKIQDDDVRKTLQLILAYIHSLHGELAQYLELEARRRHFLEDRMEIAIGTLHQTTPAKQPDQVVKEPSSKGMERFADAESYLAPPECLLLQGRSLTPGTTMMEELEKLVMIAKQPIGWNELAQSARTVSEPGDDLVLEQGGSGGLAPDLCQRPFAGLSPSTTSTSVRDLSSASTFVRDVSSPSTFSRDFSSCGSVCSCSASNSKETTQETRAS